MEEFKKPLTLDEMIVHLKKKKRVVFKKISEEEAKEILYKYNYVNIITPFKHRFAVKYKGKLVKQNNDHVYKRDVDFLEYYTLYKNERSSYQVIYNNILSLETLFNAILSYEIMHKYKINSLSKYIIFIDDLTQNIDNKDFNETRREKTKTTLLSIKALIENKTIYLLLDRLTLYETTTIFSLLPNKIKQTIYTKLFAQYTLFKPKSIKDFEYLMSKIIIIRNYICHCNSLEVLTYFNTTKRELRKDSHRKIYNKIINNLAK